jgi:hypothetical protein
LGLRFVGSESLGFSSPISTLDASLLSAINLTLRFVDGKCPQRPTLDHHANLPAFLSNNGSESECHPSALPCPSESRLGAPVLTLCLSAAQVRFRCADADIFNCVGEGGTLLPPPPKRNHERHSGLMIRTTLEAFRNAVRRRSSIEIRLMDRAARRAFLTVVMQTPATSAISLLVRRQSPRLRCSAATTARTACSARVNRLASAGGMDPEAAQRRRLSMPPGDRGRELKRRCIGFCGAGRALLSSMASDRADASASVT